MIGAIVDPSVMHSAMSRNALLPLRTRTNYLVNLTTILNFAVGKGCRSDNLAARIDRPILDDRPVGILTVEQASGLLCVAKESDPEMLPAVMIGLLAGLRRSESFDLDWSEIDF